MIALSVALGGLAVVALVLGLCRASALADRAALAHHAEQQPRTSTSTTAPPLPRQRT
ncbi:hypothetical protein WDZ16_13105 [Pseudokineococcus marinus]|uniref:Uncharacterized protein n=1 Tax=Pseudokineococcus marinus TaxID=351215 RepID=A0A849BV79_9ACTN|nr:hypothetical protein [Pseudokineococcus marinus]NNH23406.1 hypothetical protein [Pseudokineococcus marinus]